jgi:hypothetical protein
MSLADLLSDHDQSLHMLQALLDPGNRLASFWKAGRETKPKGVTKGVTRMKGVTKEKILAALKQDKALWTYVKNALKFEFSVYEYGLSLHKAHLERVYHKD